MISVVMSTYNGAQFIEEQLVSLLNQTRQPDEVLIGDDASTDNTIAIVRHFIDEHQLKNWRLIVNEQNKGWKRNFPELFLQVKGDIIFYCDQDDVWLDEKIQTMAEIMERNEKILCLGSRYVSIDQNGERVAFDDLEDFHGTGGLEEVYSDSNKFTKSYWGCTLAFRNTLLHHMRDPRLFVSPDFLLCFTAALNHGLYLLDAALIKHRFHMHNTTRSMDTLDQSHGEYTLGQRIEFIKGFYDVACNAITDDKKLQEQFTKFFGQQVKFLEHPSCGNAFKMMRMTNSLEGYIFALANISYTIGFNKLAGKIYAIKDLPIMSTVYAKLCKIEGGRHH